MLIHCRFPKLKVSISLRSFTPVVLAGGAADVVSLVFLSWVPAGNGLIHKAA